MIWLVFAVGVAFGWVFASLCAYAIRRDLEAQVFHLERALSAEQSRGDRLAAQLDHAKRMSGDAWERARQQVRGRP